MHKFGTNPWKLSFKNISLDALVLKEYDIFGLLHIYIYILATEYGNHFTIWSELNNKKMGANTSQMCLAVKWSCGKKVCNFQISI